MSSDTILTGRTKHSLQSFISAPIPATSYSQTLAVSVSRRTNLNYLIMTRLIALFVMIFALTQVIAQTPGEPRTNRQRQKEEDNHNCVETNKYTPEERMRFYPFDVSSAIKIVSFDNWGDSAISHELPMKGGEVDFSKITEQKTLKREEIDQLTNILYNVSYKGVIFYLWGTGCYNPRNAILFYDSSGHLLEFIELCFECHKERLSSDKISLGDLCNQKSTLLKSFFLSQGIEIGTIKEVR
jgi:hypothetical protein